MDPPSETGFITDVYSSPVGNHPQTEQASIDIHIKDDFDLKSSKKKNKKQKKPEKVKKGSVEDDAEIALWSPAKRQSWEARKTNPNAFYYRHVDPGVVKRTGAWDDAEKEMFMKAIKLHPPTQGKWGLFAMNIPGRVGYQCRNFYHRLLESGELREDMIPGEPVPVKTRNTSTKKKSSTPKKSKAKFESSDSEQENEIEVEVESDSPPQSQVVEPEEEEVVKEVVPEPKPEPAPFQIRSLKLFSTRVLQEDARLKAEAEKAAQTAISAFKTEEEPQDSEDESDVAINVVEDKEAAPSEIVEAAAESVERAMPEVLKWHPRMEAPWRVLGTVKEGEVVKFPAEEKQAEASTSTSNEYQCSKIMRLNSRCPLNLLLLSFPAPSNLKSAYLKAVNERLAANDEMKPFDSALHAYFASKDAVMKNPGNRDQICSEFVQKFIAGEF